MKLKIIVFSVLITLSTTASADWWDGWNNTSSSANVQGNSKGNAYGNTQGSGTGSGKANGWGTGRGDADGSVNFSLNFKGKGRTNMDTKMAADSATNTSGDALGNGAGNALTNGYLSGYGAGSNNQNRYGSRFPFGNNSNFMGHYNRIPMGYGAPNFNVPMYRQSPYLYRPLPLQIPGMQMPYANQGYGGYGGYPTPMNQQNIQTDDRLKKIQEKMKAQEKQYNAFVAKMRQKAQQKEMMEEFAKQRGVTAK